MQLEIKLIIDFGDNEVNTSETEATVREAILQGIVNPLTYAGPAVGGSLEMGWTSSGDDEEEEEAKDEDTYEVVKFYQDPSKDAEIMQTGLSLEDAKAACNEPGTSGEGWFVGFRME